jgi:hypothetical protein
MRLLLCFLLLLNSALLFANNKKDTLVKENPLLKIYNSTNLKKPIPFNRQLFHDRIDKEQDRVDLLDGEDDEKVSLANEKMGDSLTICILQQVDQMQTMIENLPFEQLTPQEENQIRIKYLTVLWNSMRRINNYTDATVTKIYQDVALTKRALIARYESKIPEFVKTNTNFNLFAQIDLLDGFNEEKRNLVKLLADQDPMRMYRHIGELNDDVITNQIIEKVVVVAPNEIFNYYSSSNTVLKSKILKSPNIQVRTIVKIINESKTPLKAMPFLNDIAANKITIEKVDEITSNPDLYFKNLVQIKINQQQDTTDTYTTELSYRALAYVRTMNELHEAKDAERFKCIEIMSPQDLYFIMLYGQDEIYTSSFIGSFKRMLARMDTTVSGDSLLTSLHYQYFRTFIRMCAGYNTLNEFLATMQEPKRITLLTNFVSNLETGKADDLEGAVNVADAFGSISDSTLSKFLRNQVKENYERCYTIRNKKGLYIYAILAALFDGLNNPKANIGKLLGLPPVYFMPYADMVNDSGKVVEHFFFYGDEDGKASYASFLTNFKDATKWQIQTNKYWVQINSKVGKAIEIYANLPLSEPEDETAQKALVAYLKEKSIAVTMLVHRGHSYHLPTTIEQLNNKAKIVMLGSCGGYHNLATVLKMSPDAHLISTKQTGSKDVNEPILKQINDRLLAGGDVSWVAIWNELKNQFETRSTAEQDKFNDYVPPHRNLGSLFIKGYKSIVARRSIKK